MTIEINLSDTGKQIVEQIQAAEMVAADFAAAVSPWLGSLIPARLAYVNLTGKLLMPVEWAFLFAVVIELMGLATINTAIMLWDYSQQHQWGATRAPFYAALGVTGFYLLIVLTVNVVLEAPIAEPWYRAWSPVVAYFLLSLISAVGGLVVAIRRSHFRTIERAAQQQQRADAASAAVLEQQRIEAEQQRALQLERLRAENELRAQRERLRMETEREIALAREQGRQQRRASKAVAAQAESVAVVAAPQLPAIDAQTVELTGNRLAVYNWLRRKPDATAQEIASDIGISRQAVSKHVAALRQKAPKTA